MVKPRFRFNPKDGGTLIAVNAIAMNILMDFVHKHNAKIKEMTLQEKYNGRGPAINIPKW